MRVQPSYVIPCLPPTDIDFQTTEILIALIDAHRYLAELKGCADSIPNQTILINTLALQEAKASSEVESYVTTQDELFQADLHISEWISPAAKEVFRYREALMHGFEKMRAQQGILSNATLIDLFQLLKGSNEGFRQHSGTVLKTKKPAQPYLSRRKMVLKYTSTCAHSKTLSIRMNPASWIRLSKWPSSITNLKAFIRSQTAMAELAEFYACFIWYIADC